jgi:transcriptional regulator with XRE-family HTH domain
MNSGTIIKLLRTAEDTSQLALAERLGVSRAYLSQVENNRKQPSLLFLKEVSKTFGVPLALLVTGENDLDSEVYNELRKILSGILTAKLRTTRK